MRSSPAPLTPMSLRLLKSSNGRSLPENVRDYRPLEIGLLTDGLHHPGLVYTSDRQFPRGNPDTLGRVVRALDALLREGQDLRDRSIFLGRADE